LTWLEEQLQAAKLRVEALPRWRKEALLRAYAAEAELGYVPAKAGVNA
jgi:hypothetical protein